MKIAIVVYEGFDELDALGPYEVLRNAAAGGADADVRLVTHEPAERITASHGLALVPQGVLEGSPDLVIVPGGGWADRAARGAWHEIQRGELAKRLAALHRGQTVMASVCTGAMLLSAAGITRGRPATTHHVALEALRDEGALLVGERVVDDGDLLSAGGVTAGLDLALWLVEREWGRRLADGVAREMEHERVGAVHRPVGD